MRIAGPAFVLVVLALVTAPAAAGTDLGFKGAGGRLSADLIDRLVIPRFTSPELDKLEDQAVLDLPAGRLAKYSI